MSLRKADNVRLSFKRGLLGRKGDLTLHVGARKEYDLGRMPVEAFEESIRFQTTYPWHLARIADRNYWHYANQYFWDNDGLSPDSVYALLSTRMQRAQQQLDRAHQMVAMGTAPRPVRRGQIPDDVRQYVWMRDHGRCRACDSDVELQFDHIIPVSMGGGGSPENLQLLCGPCNRRKGASLRDR